MLGIAFGVAPNHPDFNDLREEFFVAYEGRLTQDTQVFRGVPELLDSLTKQGLPWGVVTNKAARFTLPLTRALPLFRTAGAIVSGDTTPHAKPHPAPLFEAARLLGLDPACCMYVGDDERDIVAGLAAGMATVAATYGYLESTGCEAAANSTSWDHGTKGDATESVIATIRAPRSLA